MHPHRRVTLTPTPSSQESSGVAFESGAGRWLLAVAVLGSGTAFLDGTVVNVAQPAQIDSYVSAILPPVTVFGLGLTLVVAPVTATVLAAADTRHSGIASGVNNAVARVGGPLAVAVLPVVAGLTGDSFYDPAEMTSGFHMAMLACAALAAAGGVLAWLTIEPGVLRAEAEPGGDTPERLAEDFSCAVNGPPLRPAREAECSVKAPG